MDQKEKNMNSTKSRSWTYTLNNFTEDEIKKLEELPVLIHYCGKEKGEKDTPHLQGYITFDNHKRLSALKKINSRIHWEIAKGDEADNFIYCLKDGNTIINVNNKKQGQRTDLIKVYEKIKKGANRKEILDEFPREYIKFHGGIDKAIALNQKPRKDKPYVEWIWGPTGTGKTKYVYETYGDNLWFSLKNLKWWEGYENQHSVIFDDFRKDFCTFHELLRLLDRYPYKVELKGTSAEFNSKNIFITSCYHPEDVYNTREDIQQLIRRIDKISFLGHPGDSEESFRQNFVPEVEFDDENSL